MNGSVEEWVAKAEGDYRVASRELNAPDAPNYDAVCFHAQQCAEKLIKAVIIQSGGNPPKIHDLRQLERIANDFGVELSASPEDLRFLSMSAVFSRYPGDSADREDALRALEICSRVRAVLLARLDE